MSSSRGGGTKRKRAAAAASIIPRKSEFSSRARRFTDQKNRVYILPKKDDALLQKFVDSGDVGPDNFDRKIRKGLAFDPNRDIKALTSTAFFYVHLPSKAPIETFIGLGGEVVRHQDTVIGADSNFAVDMPALFDGPSMGRDDQGVVYLKEELTGDLYSARVESTYKAGKRVRRGFVVLSNVRKIRSGAR